MTNEADITKFTWSDKTISLDVKSTNEHYCVDPNRLYTVKITQDPKTGRYSYKKLYSNKDLAYIADLLSKAVEINA